MSDKKVKVGLVGCGNAGRGIHMVQFARHQDLYQVVCCADALPESAATLARDFGLRVMPGVDALAKDPEVELVVVVTRPPVTHRDVALKALAAGKHVVVEKPMAGSDRECAEMVEAADAAKRILSVHHNRRWDVDFLSARSMIESGALGRVRLVRNEYTAGYTGSAYDWGIHLVDQTMALSFGKSFVELSATFCKPAPKNPPESEGFFSCRLRTEDGVIHDLSMLPTVDGNAFRPGRMAYRFMIVGTEGVAYQEWCQRPEDAFAKTIFMQPVKGKKAVGDLPVATGGLAVPDFYEVLHSAIRKNTPPPVPGREGRRAVRAWELMAQSACENQTLRVSL